MERRISLITAAIQNPDQPARGNRQKDYSLPAPTEGLNKLINK
jgi:hypothetical protein